MKKIIFAALAVVMTLAFSPAFAQFTSGQVLTASQLNAALAAPTITGGSIDGAPIGASVPATGSFTTLVTSGSATLHGVTAPATGQFYAGSGASISRIQDRLFVGPAALNNGTAVASQPDWLTQYQLAKGRTYGYIQTSQFAVLNGAASQDSMTTAVFAARNFGRTDGNGQAIAVTGMGVNNATSGGSNNQAWAAYFEAFRDTGTAGNGGAYGAEIDTMNFVGGTQPVTDPYSQSSDQVVGLQMASGGGFPGTLYPTTVGLNFQNNNSTYDKGIVFGSNSITGASGTSGTGIAIALGRGHQLQWYGAAATPTSSITGQGSTSAGGVGQVFGDSQVQWLNASGIPLLNVEGVSNATNYIQTTNATSGNGPILQAIGADANVMLNLSGQGTGGVQVTSAATGSAALRVSAPNNTAMGAAIYLAGNGSTTPNKFIRAFNGVFQIANSANSATPMSMDDAGNVTFTGSVTGTGGSFTTLSASSTVSGSGFSSYFASPPAIGGTAANAGAFTTLSASSTVSGTGFSTYLASPPAIGGTAAAAGSFTTLSASGNDALTYGNTSAQSITSNSATTVTGWTKVFDRLNANFNASTGIFTAPVTGFYHVDAGLLFASGTASAVNEAFEVLVVGNGSTLCTGQSRSQQTTASIGYAATTSCLVSLAAGQTIVVQAFQNSGSSVALSSTTGGNYVSIHRVP
ncbi:beta strand repeat-containing protein [Paraburkholderia phenoliruptrix]|uniref:beta strand repeat-containing protein n=1 Tax=Paraburkholderia phenoliruptrix TaxID=252970 RepID=UPI001C6F15D2|nr:hypothetical protein [Paraburkholderia phenoliruptrix]MBW9102962.1 hypothetical protein [Paraburkholderia phenoliruptrix]MBW9132936.1 hypothetical protein [Paraburkholderia ginsengiterrae]